MAGATSAISGYREGGGTAATSYRNCCGGRARKLHQQASDGS
ncbi:hypothetical protein [Kitasatospora sp. NPDC090308]